MTGGCCVVNLFLFASLIRSNSALFPSKVSGGCYNKYTANKLTRSLTDHLHSLLGKTNPVMVGERKGDITNSDIMVPPCSLQILFCSNLVY